MIELNGWVIIRESYDSEYDNPELLLKIVAQIESRISEMHVTNEFYVLKSLNGTFHLSIMANHNHRNENVFDFFKWIAEISIGSYGILYVHDDEDNERGSENEFKVWLMKMGKVTETKDVYLSPYHPSVEK